jgi:hypothetical protein
VVKHQRLEASMNVTLILLVDKDSPGLLDFPDSYNRSLKIQV